MSPSADTYESLMQFLYQAPIGLVQIATDGAIEMLNPKSAQLLMPLAPGGELANLYAVLAPVAPWLRDAVDAFDKPSGVICEGQRFAIDGRGEASKVVSLSVMKLDEARVMASFADVTAEAARQAREVEQQLSDAARTDGLTHLPNRTVVIEALQEALDRDAGGGSQVAVLYLNGDRFRRINDCFGTAVGDVVLARIADRLQVTLRATDTLVRGAVEPFAARLGGDEFVVVLDGVRALADAESVAERLLHALAMPHACGTQRVHAFMSIGVAQSDASVRDAALLLQNASLSMVEAKRGGGARYAVFDAGLREVAARRASTEEELRRALTGDELFVVYQPVVGLQGRGDVDRAAGVEALVRWRHPVRGLVAPNDFIGIAEESGLINPLGDFVLDRACRQFRRWRDALGGAAPKLLAVNLSRAQLDDAGLVDRIAAVLADHGVAASALQLEVTESLAAQDHRVQARLADLKALGLTLALDDFGTGYSSLASLQQLPVDTIKIDRSFVAQLCTSAHHRVLVEATLRVAASLGMRTVAEGIETAEQARVLRELGCDKGQGWHFGRPMEGAALQGWLAAPAAVAA